jgi:hypothetical protein
MRFALEDEGAIAGGGATAGARVSPTFAGGKGWACCPPNETHADKAKDINRTGGRRDIGFLRLGD